MSKAAMAILSRGPDPLAEAVADALVREGTPILEVCLPQAASHTVTIRNAMLWVSGRQVGAMLIRSRPGPLTLSHGFALEDCAFVDAELSATLLAASALPSIRSVNRYDADAWFEGSGWHSWRRKLGAAGVPVSPFLFGDCEATDDTTWVPYLSGTIERSLDRKTRSALGCAITSARERSRSLAVCGRVISGCGGETVGKAVRTLLGHGVGLVEIAVDGDDRVLSVDTTPVVTDPGLVAAACNSLVRFYGEHLRRR